MKYLLVIITMFALIIACNRKADPPCHGQAIQELIMPVYLLGTDNDYTEHIRTTIRCAGKCPDGTPCDSTIELTNTSMGASVRRIRCGCRNETAKRDCGIIIEHTRYSPDSIMTDLYCNLDSNCPIESDTCVKQQQSLPTDTIRSRMNGNDSLIIKKWLITCECMDE